MLTRQHDLPYRQRVTAPRVAPMSQPKRTELRRKTMRGGLGRTLLTAFLLLAIGPLSLISIYAVSRTRAESNEQQLQMLTLLTESYRAQLVGTIEQASETLQNNVTAPHWSLDQAGALRSVSPKLPEWVDPAAPAHWQVGGEPVQLWLTVATARGWRATTVPLAPLLQRIRLPQGLQGTMVHLQTGKTISPLAPGGTPLAPATEAMLGASSPRGESVVTQVVGEDNEAMMVSRVPLNAELSLLVTRSVSDALAPSDTLAAALVAAALVAALVTTIGAALVTRSITQPLYELTRTAVQIARGDLTQRGQIKLDNELGVLALAFNTMADQLHESLATLEERVEERTDALHRATAQIQERARDLELSAELGSLLSAIHRLDTLLTQATKLITSSFDYQGTAIWLLGRRAASDPGLTLRASSFQQTNGASEHEVASSQEPLAQEVLAGGAAILSESENVLALPLRMADNLIGVLLLTHRERFTRGDQAHLQTLADTLTVAIENARASEMEQVALEKLEYIAQRRHQFLGEMSQELSTALNSIIGFSRLMLKEVEGPLTEMQRSDLTYINRNGTHLLSLLDGLLDVIDSEPWVEEDEKP